jgi:hypothetical protein
MRLNVSAPGKSTLIAKADGSSGVAVQVIPGAAGYLDTQGVL